MPKTMCPLCGAKTHINTADPERFEHKYPELLIVGYVCRLCPECAPDLVVGDLVFVRSAESGTGQVDRVATGANGFRLFRIKFESGLTATYPRSHLAKLPLDKSLY